MKLFIDIVMKRIYLFNIVAWNYRKKIGFPVCKKENFAGLQAHRKRGKSARASPTPRHTLNEERSARFTAQYLSALVETTQLAWMGKESPISRTNWWKVSFFELVKLFENDMCARDFLSLFFFYSKGKKHSSSKKGGQYLQHRSKHLRWLLLLQGCWRRICRWAFHYLIVMWSTFLNCYFPKEHYFQKTDKTRLVE